MMRFTGLKFCHCLILLSGFLISSGSVQAAVVIKNVDGQSGPWDTTLAGNAAFQYGTGDNLPATVFDAADGLTFNAGDAMTITYLDGLTSAFIGVSPNVTGVGYDYLGTAFGNDQVGSSGVVLPSFHMDPSTYPIYLNALVGTFTDASGVVVGTPFAVNNGPLTVFVPVGAAQLQLGVNDDIFFDNTGSLRVSVSQGAAAVPEPSSVALLLVGGFGLASGAYRRHRRKAKACP